MSNVKDFGAKGDGQADDSKAIQHAVDQNDGLLHLPRGDYLIRTPIVIDYTKTGRMGLVGDAGGAKVIMAGPGPAFVIHGTHQGTGDPGSVKPAVWQNQRLPTIKNLEIQGGHLEADGVLLEHTMQALFEGVLIRQCRHGIHLVKRNRNVLISHCHVYHNTGVGVFLDEVNLHQINIIGSHISYNRLGGIRIEGSEVRNLQITGNDIEYNNHKAHGTPPEPTAEIYVDTTAKGASVNEVTVASNTIQATPSPGGANIRVIGGGEQSRPPGLWAISGNIIGNQHNNVHLTGCHGMVITGNCIYSCENRNLLIENSSQINIGSNSFRRHTGRLGTGVRLVGSSDCVITGCTMADESQEGQASKASLLEMQGCQRVSVTGCQMLDGVPYGLDVAESSQVNVSACTIVENREGKFSEAAVRWTKPGRDNMMSHNTLGKGLKGPTIIDPDASVIDKDNLLIDR
jgi:polygalacturonase